MPGLLRGVARTAAIAGTATAVSNRVSRRQGQRWASQEQAAQPAPQSPPPQPQPVNAAPEPGTSGMDRITALKELGELHASGVLDDDEFRAEKARILEQ
ncbi:SHOCT domain-containing protein [Rhodococcus sp. NPDC127528]|uniref:SHOCT domain-containing protein n=1 Tax=unclassified Rhodococcus (in: high G+C Gram-positive bacteria) TaxID=192944 RepID=UPI00362EAA5D